MTSCRRWPLAVMSLLFLAGCASSGMPEARQLTPEHLEGGTEPITFTRLIVRVPAGTEIGGHHEGLLKIQKQDYTWDGNITVASDQFRVIASETMQEFGFKVLGGDDLLFEDEESGMATYQLGGTIRDLRYNTYGNLAGSKAEAWMEVEWQLNNALKEQVVFADTTKGTAVHEDEETGVAAVRKAFRAALKNLLANKEFVTMVGAPADSLKAGTKVAESRSIPRCDEPAAATLPNETESAFDAAPLIRVGDSHGSGVVISPEGHLLTAAHVVSDVEKAKARFRSGLELTGQVVALDRPQDIALVKLPGSGHACLRLAHGAPSSVGTDLFAIGAPVSEDLSFSVSKGIVSGHRTIGGYQFLQTDASINPGNSGGPLLNRHAEIIGIVSQKIAGEVVEGLGFRVPPQVIRDRLGLELQ